MATKLEKELDYFIDHQAEIVSKHAGKVVVIHHAQVVGVYDTELEATKAARQKYEMGDFLVQRAVAGSDSFHQTFYSRVSHG